MREVRSAVEPRGSVSI